MVNRPKAVFAILNNERKINLTGSAEMAPPVKIIAQNEKRTPPKIDRPVPGLKIAEFSSATPAMATVEM